MKTKNIGIIVVLVLLIGIGVWFWLSSQKGVEEAIIPEGEEEVESLTEVLEKAKGITSFKYDIVATSPEQETATVTIWLKGTKMRGEGIFEGQEVAYILDMDEQEAYVYIPAQNIAMKMDFGEVQETLGESPAEQSEFVEEYSPEIVGAEVLDGKSCLIIEYTTETSEVKTWIWTEHGLPIKTESTTTEGTSIVELKNIEFGEISDSMFELPADVQIMEIPGFGL